MASSEVPRRRNSNSQLLEELEALSQSLYQNHVSTTRRTASLVLPRTSTPVPTAEEADVAPSEEKLRSRRMSMSPWRSRPKGDPETQQQKGRGKDTKEKDGSKFFDDNAASKEKKGIWNWKPMRALSHIGMQKLSSLFLVEVVAVQGLPASMNGLRLSVCVRKKETRDGAVHTMPSRVTQGAADFDETLFIKCHVYCSQSSGSQLPKFEPRPFIIYVFAVDAAELDFGRNSVDLSRLIQESLEKNAQGSRIRQWDISFDLAGKAKGGQLQVKLSFQIMEKDGGIGLFNQLEGSKAGKDKTSSSIIGRKQSKSSFSIPSPKHCYAVANSIQHGKGTQKRRDSSLQGEGYIMEHFIKNSCRHVAQVHKKSRCEIHQVVIAYFFLLCTSLIMPADSLQWKSCPTHSIMNHGSSVYDLQSNLVSAA